MRQADSGKKKWSVLIVEDEVLQAKAIARYLELKGHKTETCHDGALAMERLKACKFDVLVTDLELPSVNGRTLAEWGLRHGGLRRVVVVSGSLRRNPIAGAGGRVKWVPKPFTLEELLDCVEETPDTEQECVDPKTAGSPPGKAEIK
ncbi:MAG: response regulator [bacterium]